MLANYHTHTTRCNHAFGTEREYIEQAIACGFSELGFSDHAPYPIPLDQVAPHHVRMDQTDDYMDTLRALRQEYADRITIHIGFEAEYYPAFFDAFLDHVRAHGCEYLILGQHFLDNEITRESSGAAATADESFLARYTDQVIAGMKTGVFTYVAHPDLVNWCGDLEVYRKHAARLCQAAKEMDIPLEINLLGMGNHPMYPPRHYPRKDFWQVAGQVGCRAVIGFDAHCPQALNCPDVLAAARAMAAECGLTVEPSLTLRRL